MALASSPSTFRPVEFLPGHFFDARRAVYFQEHGLLAVADLHLGYAWAHRAHGQLLPVGAPDDALPRLGSLIADYAPAHLVLLGDIVHRALPIPALTGQLRGLLGLANTGLKLSLLAGNHDSKLQGLLRELGAPDVLRKELRAGNDLFLHGDRPPTVAAPRCVIGHEHPAFSLGDGVATSQKFPCFLIADDVVALPSFSAWSAHTSIASGPFLSPIARAARFHTALAILGDRLLPIPLRG